MVIRPVVDDLSRHEFTGLIWSSSRERCGNRSPFPDKMLRNRRQSRFLFLRLASGLIVAAGVAGATPELDEGNSHSLLWGRAGESWSPESRLPDFSMAGYRRGEEPRRIPSSALSVSDFGADGRDEKDDTEAFRKAIAAGTGCVIHVPRGRYHIDGPLEFRQSNVVLRGEGRDQSILVFQRGLEAIEPRPVKNDAGTTTSDWSWRGGFIRIGANFPEGAPPAGETTPISRAARRGETALHLHPHPFRTGDEVVLTLRDDAAKSLVHYLYRGKAGDTSRLNDWSCRQIFRVLHSEGGRITLDRPLRFDVRPEWQPVLSPFRPEVTDVGIESLGFVFPAVVYPGHFQEKGFNPLTFLESAAHCWARDIHVQNGDNGPFIEGAAFITIEDIVLDADPSRVDKHGHTGHHGITIMGDDCLCRGFDLRVRFIHDLTVQSAIGSVFASGRAVNLSMDHHRWAPYENLFTNIDAGGGSRLFESSGGGNRGLHTAAGATFWNIRARQPSPWPENFGPDQINIIAVPMSAPRSVDPHGRWHEEIPPGKIHPPDLHEAMLNRRFTTTR